MAAKLGSVLLVWGKWLPYHFARVQACAECFKAAGYSVVGIQYSDVSIDYRIKAGAKALQFEFLNPRLGNHETDFRPWRILNRWPLLIRQHQARVVFVPSYWDWSVTIAVVSRMLGCRVVMMNESHAGTEQATGWKKWIKRQIVKQFDAALVGGEPHKRHFASLGIPAEKIFTGYDAVDGAYFAAKADEVRSMEHGAGSREGETRAETGDLKPEVGQAEQQNLRSAYGLPERYFLSLGRMVEKKNLSTLVEAYARFARESVEKHGAGSVEHGAAATETRHPPASLVFVGSGELESALREQARGLGLRVVDRTEWGANKDKTKRLRDEETRGLEKQAEPLNSQPSTLNEENRGTVFFYGFRQIEENAVFYALAEAFVLPSLYEEWGLVVNEAMAAGLPVIVSRTAGCAEDLLPEATASRGMERGAGSREGEADARAARPYLEQRSNGFVFEPVSVDALSEALRRIADYATTGPRDKGTADGGDAAATLRAVMGRRSREIVAKFSCENFAKQALRAACAAQQA